ncbi:MAG: PD40 domain-containing protein, partial [Gemmatimonadetes bacterium]|nr:PD40 domain-containing protein [Gemmatimonadota bacterium]
VAVKVLRPELAAAVGSERFLREIKITANLTHPHILPLHDSGEAEGFLYYVMPFIRGQTLRERIVKEGELPVNETVRIIREVVDALAFAHSEGVVHRDIKPDNVMLTGGHAVVADFGIAKAVSEAAGRDQLTKAGVPLGTPAYMSPEQATGNPHVDHRTDIYAVGVMAYELLTGRTPFTGSTLQSIIAAHVTEQVDPVSRYRDQVSGELEAVVMKCLAKKPADRWQSAEELLPHLETLVTSSGGLTPTATMPVSAVSGVKKYVSPAVVAGVLALVVVGVWGTRLLKPGPFTITTSNERQITSDLGLEFEPSLSPDGERIVYSKGGPFKTHPYVEVLGTASALRLGEDLPGHQRTPVWTADGNSVTFGQRLLGVPGSQLGVPGSQKSTSMVGGTVTTLDVPRNAYEIAWSADGSRIVYPDSDGIYVRAAEGGEATLIADSTIRDFFGFGHSFAWSPDGQRIAFVQGNLPWLMSDALGNIAPSGIWLVDADSGGLVPVTENDGVNVSPQWLPDGRHLLFISNRDVRRAIYVVEVGKDGAVGEPQRLSGGSNPHSISVSADGRRLAYSNFNYARNIFSYPIPETGTIKLSDGERITSGTEVIEQFSVSPDGEWIAFDSNLNGNQDIFKMRLDGSERSQLTSDPGDDFLIGGWSPDMTEIAFDGVRDGVGGARVVSADGTQDVGLLADEAWGTWSVPFWSPTGLELGLFSVKSGRGGIWITSRDRVGGEWSEPVQLTDSGCLFGDWSPDGSKIVCGWNVDFGIKLFSRSGELLWHLEPDFDAGVPAMFRPRFSADGSTLYVYGSDAEGSQGIWAIPTEGGAPRLVIENDDESRWIYSLSLRVHGDRIYFSVAEYESDIWVMDLEY